jgi:hypothetical protein
LSAVRYQPLNGLVVYVEDTAGDLFLEEYPFKVRALVDINVHVGF